MCTDNPSSDEDFTFCFFQFRTDCFEVIFTVDKKLAWARLHSDRYKTRESIDLGVRLLSDEEPNVKDED